MTDATSLPLDYAHNPRELALLRLFRLIPEGKKAEAVDSLIELMEEPRPGGRNLKPGRIDA